MASGDQFEKGARIERFEKRLSDPTAALNQVGAMLVAQAQRSFKDQSFDGQGWKPRRVPNVMGIIADLYEGKTPPARRFEDRPALRDTGRLAQSISWRIVGADSVEAGTTLPYASVHQTGGEVESKPITEGVKTNLKKFLDSAKGKPYRKALGWLFNDKYHNRPIRGKVPARPFIGVTKQLVADVGSVVGVRIASD